MTNDCVIVPGWGALIGHYEPARFSDNGTRISPPRRSLTFNPALTHNDGLLAGSIMRRHGMTYEAATKAIDDEVDTLRHQLSCQGEVALENVGLFRHVDTATPQFEPAASGLSMARFLALPSFNVCQIKELAKADTDSGQPVGNDVAGPVVPAFSRYKSIFLRVAASVAVLACIVSALTLPVGPDKTSIVSMASLGLNIESHEATGSTEVVDIVEHRQGDIFIALPVDDTDHHSKIDTARRAMYRGVVEYNKAMAKRRAAVELANAKALSPDKKQTINPAKTAIGPSRGVNLTINDNDSFCLIVSSHATRAEADKYIARHSSTPMRVLEQDGRYRVYIATGKSGEEVRRVIASQTVRSRYPGAWVCPRVR